MLGHAATVVIGWRSRSHPQDGAAVTPSGVLTSDRDRARVRTTIYDLLKEETMDEERGAPLDDLEATNDAEAEDDLGDAGYTFPYCVNSSA